VLLNSVEIWINFMWLFCREYFATISKITYNALHYSAANFDAFIHNIHDFLVKQAD